MAGSLPLPLKDIAFRNVALAVLGFVLAFDVGTYSYYRGSVVTPFHGGPVSPTKHHLTLSDARVLPDGAVRFHVYLDAGTPKAPVHVVAADLLDANNRPVAHYAAAALSALPKTDFANDYAYNKFAPGPFGIRAPMGAAAIVTLPRQPPVALLRRDLFGSRRQSWIANLKPKVWLDAGIDVQPIADPSSNPCP
jgi:hypothetical protein